MVADDFVLLFFAMKYFITFKLDEEGCNGEWGFVPCVYSTIFLLKRATCKDVAKI